MPRYLKPLLPVILLLSSLPSLSQDRALINQNLALLDSIYSKVTRFYVEKSMPPQLFRSAIDASLRTLDPFSAYMNTAEASEFTLSMKAKYGGLGFAIAPMNDSFNVREIFRDAPADKNGIKPGDFILEINGVPVKGNDVDQVVSMLRGEPGSTIKMKLFRPSEKTSREISTSREVVNLPSVPYYGLLPGDHGYIKITGETDQTVDEARKALLELKKKTKLNGLVLDLRGNMGGKMFAAIGVANFFIEKGKVAVSEKSWYTDTSFLFMDDPIDTEIPLVVLIDTFTVSAGEILSGALQDHDRAILIGQKTFGKGMVQRTYNLPNNQLLKLTTSYYYTPSGRCIQRKEEGGERTRNWSDSMKGIVYTSKGRPLASYDGIGPDISMQIPEEPAFARELLSWPGNYLFRYTSAYLSRNPRIAPASTFRITDKDYDDFIAFLKKEKFQMTSESEQKIAELKNTLAKEGYTQAVYSPLSSIQDQLNREKEKQFLIHKKEIKSLVEREIAALVYYNWGRVENSLKDDEVVKKAVEVLGNWGKYKYILTQRTQ